MKKLEYEDEVFIEHYSKLVRWVKGVIDDERLSSESKIRLLGVAL